MMKTTKRHIPYLLAGVLLLALASCVKDDLYDTPHSDRGVVAVAIDLPTGTAADDFTVEIGGTQADKNEDGYIVSEPLPPSEYTVLAHNTPQGFNIADGVARVNEADGTRTLPTLIEPRPGYLYSGTERIFVTRDDTVRVHLDVAQRVRDLHLRLTVTEGDPERIASLTGTLSGIAGAFDLMEQAVTGEAASTRFAFTRTGDKVSADLRLLGTVGAEQMLTLEITFTDGQTQTVECDLTEALAGFNGGMEAVTLAGDLRTPTEMGIGGCTITPWIDGGGGSGSAY